MREKSPWSILPGRRENAWAAQFAATISARFKTPRSPPRMRQNNRMACISRNNNHFIRPHISSALYELLTYPFQVLPQSPSRTFHLYAFQECDLPIPDVIFRKPFQ